MWAAQTKDILMGFFILFYFFLSLQQIAKCLRKQLILCYDTKIDATEIK